MMVLYPHFVYPIILSFFSKSDLQIGDSDYYKSLKVSLIIVLKNEEAFLRQYKDQYEQTLNGLPDFQIVCINDGSTDGTPTLLEGVDHDRFSFVSYEKSEGKNLRIREFLEANPSFYKSSILCFADGNTQFTIEAIIQMIGAFQDSRVGCCSSVLEYSDGLRFEGTYWHNENKIKRQESDIHSQIGATGALFAIREEVYEPQKDSFPIDLALSLNAILMGYSSISTYKSRVFEEIKEKSVADRKYRTLIRGMSCALYYVPLLLQQRRYRGVFCLLSHKVIRWMSPFFLIVMMSGFSMFSIALLFIVLVVFIPYSPIYLIKIFWSSIKAFLFFVIGKTIKKW